MVRASGSVIFLGGCRFDLHVLTNVTNRWRGEVCAPLVDEIQCCGRWRRLPCCRVSTNRLSLCCTKILYISRLGRDKSVCSRHWHAQHSRGLGGWMRRGPSFRSTLSRRKGERRSTDVKCFMFCHEIVTISTFREITPGRRMVFGYRIVTKMSRRLTRRPWWDHVSGR